MNNLKLKSKYIKKVDVFILNQALHHCANPAKLLHKMSFYLKKNGFILIREPEISFFLQLLLFLLNDESWSFKADIFNKNKNIFSPKSPWDANNATAYLLFNDVNKFYSNFPQYKIIKNDLSEFFIFINSGGVVQEKIHLPTNKFVFSILNFIDKMLIFLLPRIFALGRSVVLQKVK